MCDIGVCYHFLGFKAFPVDGNEEAPAVFQGNAGLIRSQDC